MSESGQNRISYLPESFGNLVKLKFLSISKNVLEYLPENIGGCLLLQDFSLDNNKVSIILYFLKLIFLNLFNDLFIFSFNLI